jgi:twitching motility protein PilT
MDDALFELWKSETVKVTDLLHKAHNPNELAKRIVAAQHMQSETIEGVQ